MRVHEGSLPGVAEYRSGGSTPAEPIAKVRTKHYLHAGQYFVSERPTAVTTILGSCVAVCLWEPKSGIGGVNHFVLPSWAGQGRASPRFGNVAVSSLIEDILSRGCLPSSLRAKIFGGASLMSQSGGGRLGTQNIAAARSMLESEEIRIVSEDVGGDRGRKLIFHSDDGVAWIKRL